MNSTAPKKYLLPFNDFRELYHVYKVYEQHALKARRDLAENLQKHEISYEPLGEFSFSIDMKTVPNGLILKGLLRENEIGLLGLHNKLGIVLNK